MLVVARSGCREPNGAALNRFNSAKSCSSLPGAAWCAGCAAVSACDVRHPSAAYQAFSPQSLPILFFQALETPS